MSRAMSKLVIMSKVGKDHILEKLKDLKVSQSLKHSWWEEHQSTAIRKSDQQSFPFIEDRKSPKEMVFCWCFRH